MDICRNTIWAYVPAQRGQVPFLIYFFKIFYFILFFYFLFFPVLPHVLCGLRDPPSLAWQDCNRLLRWGPHEAQLRCPDSV